MIEDLKSFWGDIWNHEKSYVKRSRWIKNIKDTYQK